MPGQGQRTGIKRQDIDSGKSFVDFEGGKAEVVNIGDDGHGGVRLDLDTHEGPRSRISIYGKYHDYGDGFELVETSPRGYW